uniref:Uncharacterized protein n=1 Tax=Ciona intestinalis TaxID=7719 RepID=F6XXU3_CIOIN
KKCYTKKHSDSPTTTICKACSAHNNKRRTSSNNTLIAFSNLDESDDIDKTSSFFENEVVVPTDFHCSVQTIFTNEVSSLNSWQKLFIDQQVKNANSSSSGHRYHPDVVRWAIELFSRSPSAYEHLRTTGVLTLPAKSTIASYRNSISPEPGLNTKALEEIERVV